MTVADKILVALIIWLLLFAFVMSFLLGASWRDGE